jgi:hypothetical protein
MVQMPVGSYQQFDIDSGLFYCRQNPLFILTRVDNQSLFRDLGDDYIAIGSPPQLQFFGRSSRSPYSVDLSYFISPSIQIKIYTIL